MDERDISIGNDVTMRGGSADTIAVIDQFEILRKLGGGGFGSVYLARDSVAGIEVAVKGLPPVVRNNTEELERIRANFALVSRLHHPYIAAALHLHRVQQADYRVNGVYEELNVGPGDTLMIMEYAPGVTLSQWRKQFPGGKVPLEVAVNLVYQIAMALDYSHNHHILHRDIKPSNVMVETLKDGSFVARVLDFGLAAEIKSSMGRVSMEIHDTSGTRPYMAPEQWAGRKQGPAADQYALACLFCELITGEVPLAPVFETGDPMVMMTAVCNREVELPPDCPRSHALKKALSKDPKDRYGTCAEFLENIAKSEARFDVEHGLDGASSTNLITAIPAEAKHSGAEKPSLLKKHRRLALGGVCLLACVLVCAGIISLRKGREHAVSTPQYQGAHVEATPVKVPKKSESTRNVGEVHFESTVNSGVCEEELREARMRRTSKDVLSGTQKERSVTLVSARAYRVSNRYIVPRDAELVVESGTKIIFDAGAGLVVQGKIRVCGRVDRPAVFCGASDGRGVWDGIKIFDYNGSTIDGALFAGAKVAVDLSKAGVSIFNSVFRGNEKALHAKGHCGKGSLLENCLIMDNDVGVTFHSAALDFRTCSFLRNDNIAIGGSYYGDVKLSGCVVVGNGKGIEDGGYDGSAAAHGCVIYGNKEFDVSCRSSKAGDFTGNWWGPDTTKILNAEGDGVKLPNIKGNFVNIAEFLTKRPVSCGSSLPKSQGQKTECNLPAVKMTAEEAPRKATQTKEEEIRQVRPVEERAKNNTRREPLDVRRVVGMLTYEYDKGLGTWSVVGCAKDAVGEVNILGELDGLKVSRIGTAAFSGCSGIAKIVIPPEVEEIGFCSFERCDGLKELVLPMSLKKIHDLAFSECRQLMRLTIPSGAIGNKAFSGCERLSSLTIGSKVTAIGVESFYECKRLTHVEISCEAKIGDRTFCGCEWLKDVTLKGVTGIGDQAFCGCMRLPDITIPSTVKEIGSEAFWNCKGLKSISISPGLKKIGYRAFIRCETLAELKLPSSVETIGKYAFEKCTGLGRITLSPNLQSVEYGVFMGCRSLSSVVIPMGVADIGDYTFAGCSQLQSVSIPSSVTGIGDSAFNQCQMLKSVTIPPSVERLHERAFDDGVRIVRGK